MALDALVDSTQLDSDLTDVADEIRTAGGTLLPLSFPDDYVVAIGDIGNTEIKTASGSIAHFEDALARKAQDLTVAIEPVQDLHGYDNPWPDGGGINLVDKFSAESYGGTVSADGLAVISKVVTASGNSNFARGMFSNPFDAVTSETLYISVDVRLLAGTMDSFAIQVVGGSSNTTMGISKFANVPSTAKQRFSFSGSPNRDDPVKGIYIQAQNANGAQLEISNIQISKIEDYNYHPYSNICPIRGWTGANVTRTGRNLLDTKNFAPTSSSSGGITTVQNQDGTFAASGTASGIVNLWLRGNYGASNPVLKLYAGKQYIIKDVMLYRDTTRVTPTCYIGSAVTYSPQSDVLITGVRASTPIGTTLDTTIYPYITDSGDSAWQEFGDTYSITFPSEAGTVYGGTLDVTTGKLTVDRAMVDLGTLTWENRYTETNNKTILSHLPLMLPHAQNRKIISENYKYHGFVVATAALQHPDSLDVGLRTYYMTDYPQSDDVVYAVIPVSESPDGLLVYELATPIVYDLTPTEVTTLLGTNNVWADAGDSTIKYIAPKAQIPSAQGVNF